MEVVRSFDSTNVVKVARSLKDERGFCEYFSKLDAADQKLVSALETILSVTYTGKSGEADLDISDIPDCLRLIRFCARAVSSQKVAKTMPEDYFTVVYKRYSASKSIKTDLLGAYELFCKYGEGAPELQKKLAPPMNLVADGLELAIGTLNKESAEIIRIFSLASQYMLPSSYSDLNGDVFWPFIKAILSFDYSDFKDTFRLACTAIANIIVPWYKFVQEPQYGIAEEGNALGALRARMVSQVDSADLSAMLHLAANWCYASQRAATELYEAAQKLSVLMKPSKPKDPIVTKYLQFLRNLLRKQPSDYTLGGSVDIPKTLITEDLVKDLLGLSKLSDYRDLVFSCVLNSLSSNHGRSAFADFEHVAFQQLQDPKCPPFQAELSFGIIWGLTSRNRLKNEKDTVAWFTVITIAMQRHKNSPRCLKKGAGAIIFMLLAQPSTKKVLSSFAPNLRDLAKANSNNFATKNLNAIVDLMAN